MGRLVRKPQVADPGLPFEGLEDVILPPTAPAGDGYLLRAVKYVPAEVIGGFMLVNAILAQAVISGGPSATMASVPVTAIGDGALLLGLLLTPLFCWYVHEDGDAWVVNAALSTLAFPVWSYLLGALAFADYHDGNLAAILVLTFTAISGLVSPPARRPKRKRERMQAVAKEGPRLAEALTA